MKITIIFFVLLTGFTFGGCTTLSEDRATGISYLIKEYSRIQHKQGAVKADSVPLGSTNPGPTVQPVKPQLPDKQTVEKKVYLTFDDGPEATITPYILDILDTYGVKATFFVIGTCMEKNPELLKEIVKRGHALGNHSYNHKYRDLYSVKDGFLNSLKINGELIYRTTGLRPDIVRDPGGKVRNNGPVKKALAENKYRLVEWNVDSYDSRTPHMKPPQLVENVRLQIMNPRIWRNMIILLHDGKGHANTVEALPDIIEMLKNEGFKFEVLK